MTISFKTPISVRQATTNLVNTYINQIELVSAAFYPEDDAKSDVATLELMIPDEMIKDYLKLTLRENGVPNAVDFWNTIGIVAELYKKDCDNVRYAASLSDVLDNIHGAVRAEFGKKQGGKTLLEVIEVPEYYTDADFSEN